MTRHKRLNPGVEVAACGERSSQISLVSANGQVTCAACLARVNDPATRDAWKARARLELAAKAKRFGYKVGV